MTKLKITLQIIKKSFNKLKALLILLATDDKKHCFT